MSFDGTEAVTGSVARPERYRELRALLTTRASLIARGAGLSYCAASMGEAALSVDMTRFDRVLSFETETGLIRVEAGLRVGSLTDFLVSRRRYLPVLPGYPDITVGGCAAFDVHGKSQTHTGNFADWVDEIRLCHPDYGELRCSRTERPEIFDLTLGGFGLTGVMTELVLRTAPLPSSALEVERVAVRSVADAVSLMQARAPEVDGLYSWHDLNKRKAFGSGFVFVERFVNRRTDPAPRRRSGSLRLRSTVPLWNRITTPVVMRAYAQLQRAGRSSTAGIRPAMFPIEGLEAYYTVFGKRGFREYQTIVPFGAWPSFFSAVEALVHRHSIPLPLASLKLFRGKRRQLAFAGEGVCLAMDVPAVAEALAFFDALDALVLSHGGCVNLSKDSRISADLCRSVFPAYESFRRALLEYDPRRRFQSRLRDRIGV